MTLRELWMLVVRYWILVLVFVIVGMLLGFGCSFLRDVEETYEAEANVLANSNLQSVAGFAENAARNMQSELEENNIALNVEAVSSNMTVTVKAKGPDSQSCIETVNRIAEYANESATEMYLQFENPFKGEVSFAVKATLLAPKSAFEFVPFGFMCGIFIAIVVLLLLNLKNRLIKTVDSVQTATDLPVLEILPASSGEKLLANIRFAAARMDNASGELSILVIPVGSSDRSAQVRAFLASAIAAEGESGLVVTQALPLSESISGAYAAKDVDVVIVVVDQWKDSIPALVSCIDELRFAEAKIAGLVFCKESKNNAA